MFFGVIRQGSIEHLNLKLKVALNQPIVVNLCKKIIVDLYKLRHKVTNLMQLQWLNEFCNQV